MFILVLAEGLLQSDRDDPEREIFLQKPLILQKLSRQQKLVEVSRLGIDDYFNYVVDSNSTKELSPPNFQDFSLKNLAKLHYFLFLSIHFPTQLSSSPNFSLRVSKCRRQNGVWCEEK
jgi:hypothetical protein